MVVDVSTTKGFSAGAHTGYDVMPDGRFVMAARPEVAEASVTHRRVVYRQ